MQTATRALDLYRSEGVGGVLDSVDRWVAYRKYRVLERWYFWTSETNTEAYRKLMKYRLEAFGPGQAVGGFDDGIGQLQFDFMTSHGLDRNDTLLDLGCGVLRGGEHYIPYLNAGNYVGMDISSDAIREGKNRLGSKVFDEKQPSFYVNDDLRFREVSESVDYVIAQSVFSHLPRDDIRECFEHLPDVLADDGVLYATFSDRECTRPKNYGYPDGELVELASDCGLKAEVLPREEYLHPYGQRMLRVTL